MGFVGFAMKSVDVLAWPLLSLGYPLCASVRAIESNSNSDMQKLIAYWILYSLISLMELGSIQMLGYRTYEVTIFDPLDVLLDCLIPFWPYIKLMAICWLVLPCFDGANHVYNSLIRPCFYVNPLDVFNRFRQPKDFSLSSENFLAMAQRYVAENGSEALEKLILSKSKDVKPSCDVEGMNAVANKEKIEATSTIQVNNGKPVPAYVEGEALADLEIKEMTIASMVSAETKLSEKNIGKKDERGKCNDFDVVQKDLEAVEPTAMVSAAAVKVNWGSPNLIFVEKKTDAAIAVKEATAASVSGGEMKLPEAKKVQKEWTCAVCQLTVQSEKVWNTHLSGRKHRANCEKLKTGKQTERESVKQGESNEVNKVQEKCGLGSESSGKQNSADKPKQSQYWCSLCGLSCPGETQLISHFNGRKHLSKIQAMTRNVGCTNP